MQVVHVMQCVQLENDVHCVTIKTVHLQLFVLEPLFVGTWCRLQLIRCTF